MITIDCLVTYHTVVGDIAQLHSNIPCAIRQRPCATGSACHLTILGQSHSDWSNTLPGLIVKFVSVLHELILAKNVLAGIFEVSLDAVVSQSLTIELKRCCAEPSFLVDKQLVNPVLETFTTQQRKEGNGPYFFLRVTDRQLDTKARVGLGHPVKPVGLIVSSFRPSDDATQFDFLVPSNFFAVDILRKAATVLSEVNHNAALSARCTALANEVEAALKKYAVVKHPEFGEIYAFEVDGFGNSYMMDDANVPSLLSLGYLIPSMASDPIYQNTRRFVWSSSNPYFFKGKAGEGIGGPHIGTEVIWPMSIMMKAFTATDDAEIKSCMEQLLRTDAGLGFIHESFHKDDATNFTRPWFAWQNTLFGELVLKLVNDGKLDVLNSVKVK